MRVDKEKHNARTRNNDSNTTQRAPYIATVNGTVWETLFPDEAKKIQPLNNSKQIYIKKYN